jgi:hypothetical protein
VEENLVCLQILDAKRSHIEAHVCLTGMTVYAAPNSLGRLGQFSLPVVNILGNIIPRLVHHFFARMTKKFSSVTSKDLFAFVKLSDPRLILVGDDKNLDSGCFVISARELSVQVKNQFNPDLVTESSLSLIANLERTDILRCALRHAFSESRALYENSTVVTHPFDLPLNVKINSSNENVYANDSIVQTVSIVGSVFLQGCSASGLLRSGLRPSDTSSNLLLAFSYKDISLAMLVVSFLGGVKTSISGIEESVSVGVYLRNRMVHEFSREWKSNLGEFFCSFQLLVLRVI